MRPHRPMQFCFFFRCDVGWGGGVLAREKSAIGDARARHRATYLTPPLQYPHAHTNRRACAQLKTPQRDVVFFCCCCFVFAFPLLGRSRAAPSHKGCICHFPPSPRCFFLYVLEEVEVKEKNQKRANHSWGPVRLEETHAVQVHRLFVIAGALVNQLGRVVRHGIETLASGHEVL
jgi:hypothetical protein